MTTAPRPESPGLPATGSSKTGMSVLPACQQNDCIRGEDAPKRTGKFRVASALETTSFSFSEAHAKNASRQLKLQATKPQFWLAPVPACA